MSRFVLVPGAGGAGWYWHLVKERLIAQGHDAVAVELPAADESAGLPEYTEAVLAAIGERRDVTLVAQSMGGFSAPQVCTQVPVKLLVLVNAMIPVPGETPGEWWGNTGQPEARRAKDLRDGRDPDAEFDLHEVFLHDVPPAIVEELLRHEADQSDTPFEQPWPLEAWPDVPTRVIVGRDDRLFPAEFQRRVARERLWLDADEVPGGHLIALSQPEAVTAQLLAYHAGVPAQPVARPPIRARRAVRG